MAEHLLILLIEHYGYGAIFAAMTMESMHLPVPSELVLGFAGYLVYLGKFSFTAAVTAAWLGSLTGSLLLYTFSRTRGRIFILKWGHCIKLPPERLEVLGSWFAKYGPLLIIPWRLLPFVRTKSSIIAGLLNMEFLPFGGCSAIGIALWCASAVALGRYLGHKWQEILELVISISQPFMVTGLVLILTGIGCVWYWRRSKTAH